MNIVEKRDKLINEIIKDIECRYPKQIKIHDNLLDRAIITSLADRLVSLMDEINELRNPTIDYYTSLKIDYIIESNNSFRIYNK